MKKEKVTKALFPEYHKKENELIIDGYTLRDFITSDEEREYYKNRYIEQCYTYWIESYVFDTYTSKQWNILYAYEKANNLSKADKKIILKMISWQEEQLKKEMPDINKFKVYLEKFGIEYKEYIDPSEEYKNLPELKVLKIQK